MAHKKGVGSSRNGRDSIGRRLGIKVFGGGFAKKGSILIRQKGTKIHPGKSAFLGKDHTIHAARNGFVKFKKKKGRLYLYVE